MALAFAVPLPRRMLAGDTVIPQRASIRTASAGGSDVEV
jgi:hypothetical protein